MDQQTQQDFEPVGTGTTVFTDDGLVEGPVVFLDSPQAVIEFVGGDAVKDTIVLARGGTTTFLTPALTSGVKGVITLQGAPTSHLGILSREYGIPCVMGVTFEKGVRSSRGEVIPADGVRVRLDISAAQGRVLVEPGAPVDDTPLAEPDADEAAMAEQIAVLLQSFQGTIPHGSEGDAQVRADFRTDVLTLTDENTGRELTVAEANELQRYMAWNIWDFLALRATEGESGLIPRQEYECFGCIHQWQRYPDFYRLILDRVGADGLVDIGGIARREPANKVNLLHVWCSGFTPMFGRALLNELGMATTDDRADDGRLILQFMRRLYRGVWGEGGDVFTSMQGYKAPLLDQAWIDRFTADQVAIDGDEARRSLFQAFNANTEMLGFLLHFDNRSGLNDSGPYDLGDGRFMIVRDHFLHDPMYHWHDVAADLPHCLTQAMVFRPDGELATALMDGGTLFTEPANYLKHLESMAVYRRETWDTPASEIRLIDEAEMRDVLERTNVATDRLYKRIASMPKREKIACGAAVYYGEFVAAVARAAGVWQELLDEHDFWEYDEVTSQSYFPLVRDGLGAQLVGKLFITGTGFAPYPDGAFDEVPLDALHRLALRGSLAELDGAEGLEASGLVVKTAAGWMLTEAGTAKHAALLQAERRTLDLDALGTVYERFLAANGPFKALNAKWQSAGEDERWELVGQLADLVGRVEPALRRTTEALPRFGGYAGRLQAAQAKVEEGEHDYVTSHSLDSLHTVWMEVHEDYLQTLGRSREEEGSY